MIFADAHHVVEYMGLNYLSTARVVRIFGTLHMQLRQVSVVFLLLCTLPFQVCTCSEGFEEELVKLPRTREPKFLQACMKGHSDEIKILLSENPNYSLTKYNKGLRLACQYGHPAVVQMLLEDGRVDPCDNHSNALTDACFYANTEVVGILLQDGRADPRATDSYCLRSACIQGETAIVEMLLRDGRADPAAKHSLGLRKACENGYTEIVRLLLKDGKADPSAENSYCLRVTLKHKYMKIVKMLLLDKRVELPRYLLQKHLGLFLRELEIEFKPWQYEAIFEALPSDLKSLLAAPSPGLQSHTEIVKAREQYLMENPVAIFALLRRADQRSLSSPAFAELLRIRGLVLRRYLDEKYPNVHDPTKDTFIKNVPSDAPLSQQSKAFECFCNLLQVQLGNFMDQPLELMTKLCFMVACL